MRVLCLFLLAMTFAGCAPLTQSPANSATSNAPSPPIAVDTPAGDAVPPSPNTPPFDQNPQDAKITTAIREKIHSQVELSANAHDVQIITGGGRVSLRGTVDSDAERDQVEAAAAEVVGTDNVTSDLIVK